MGEPRFSKAIDLSITVIAMAMVIYHLISTQYLLLGPIEHQNAHLGFSLLLVFLTALVKDKNRLWPLTLVFLLGALVTVLYIQIFYLDLENRMEFPTTLDLVMGGLLLVVVLEATRRALGLVLTAVALFFIAYALFGHYLPHPFDSFPISFTQLIYELSTGFTGIYGIVLSVSANYIFLFVLLGGIIKVSGGPRFFQEVGLLVGKWLKGGPAMTAVVGSTLVGSVTGSPSANVALTGSFTIPLMKQAGYRPEQAAAIEAAASTGGQIMPPVMSAAAFVMAGITGIPYSRVMLAALLPAIAGFLVPFMIAWCPILILEPQGSLLIALFKLVALAISIICIQVGINDHFFLPCRFFERVLFFLCAALLFLGSPFQGGALFASLVPGMGLFVFLTTAQLRRKKFASQTRLEQEIRGSVPSV